MKYIITTLSVLFLLASCSKDDVCYNANLLVTSNSANAIEYCFNGTMGDYPALEETGNDYLGIFCTEEERDSLVNRYNRTDDSFVCDDEIAVITVYEVLFEEVE